MPTLTAGWSHLIIALAGIGAFAALGATGHISPGDATAGIAAFGGVGLGTSATAIGTSAGAAAATPPVIVQQQPPSLP
jgi:hypothetical protein